jgi:hypothetical protein
MRRGHPARFSAWRRPAEPLAAAGGLWLVAIVGAGGEADNAAATSNAAPAAVAAAPGAAPGPSAGLEARAAIGHARRPPADTACGDAPGRGHPPKLPKRGGPTRCLRNDVAAAVLRHLRSKFVIARLVSLRRAVATQSSSSSYRACSQLFAILHQDGGRPLLPLAGEGARRADEARRASARRNGAAHERVTRQTGAVVAVRKIPDIGQTSRSVLEGASRASTVPRSLPVCSALAPVALRAPALIRPSGTFSHSRGRRG